jgi:hypothetical protein
MTFMTRLRRADKSDYAANEVVGWFTFPDTGGLFDLDPRKKLALNQRFSNLQVLRSSDGEKEKTNEHDNKPG